MRGAQIQALIADGEGQRTEFKESFSEKREAIESLCAFAHSLGGTVIFGVRDDGSVCGVQLGKKTLEDFANTLKQNTQPLLAPGMTTEEIDDKKVVLVSIPSFPPSHVCFAFNCAFIRVGRTNQHMSPEEIRQRHFEGFKAEAQGDSSADIKLPSDKSWQDVEKHRIALYEKSRGLFLVHEWRPSSDPEQVADVVIFLRQHPSADQPLMDGSIKSVDYHLGAKFSDKTIVKTDPDDSFKLEISAYGPLLCVARVNFDDGHAAISLNRYIDF